MENGMKRWVELTHLTGAVVQGCASYYVSRLLPHCRGSMSKSSVATFSSIMVRWSELRVTGD